MTKGDWFAIAGQVLAEHGPSALTIEELTRRAGVTKGSFYHHFGSQPGFVDAFVNHLSQLGFADVATRVDTRESPRNQLRQMVRLVAEHDPALERAVRRWSVTSPAVAQMLAEVDRLRLDFLRQLFEQAIGDPDLAVKLARLNLACYLGGLQLDPVMVGEEYVEAAGLLEGLTFRRNRRKSGERRTG